MSIPRTRSKKKQKHKLLSADKLYCNSNNTCAIITALILKRKLSFSVRTILITILLHLKSKKQMKTRTSSPN